MSVTTQTACYGLEQPPCPVKRFTVNEYHRIVDADVFAHDERLELLEGWIVPKMTRNPPHEVALVLAYRALQSKIPSDWHFRIQSAITTADSEPEPDLALVRGDARDYLSRHPGAGDVALLIEVADSSLAQDRSLKGRLYARAGIPIMWIINLSEAKVEVYTDPTGPDPAPRYRAQQDHGAADSVPLFIDGHEVGRVNVLELLP
jgi:Putative restriction endonuclease